MVDDELHHGDTAGGRAVRALAEELRARGIEVVESLSAADGRATVESDAGLHCVFVNWTLGDNSRTSHAQALELPGAAPITPGSRSS
jgi:arginine decarboxylase